MGEFSSSGSFTMLKAASSLIGKAAFDLDSLVFYPPENSYADDQLVYFDTSDGFQLAGIHLPNPEAEYTILYSHGNGENLAGVRQALELIKNIGFSVFCYDYRGYGKSEGHPSIKGVCKDIEAAYRYLTQKLEVPFNRIIAYGHSLGSGPAVDLASRYRLGGLVVEGGFTSILRVVVPLPFIPFDQLVNSQKIRRINCPVLIIHGTADEVIHLRHGQELYKSAPNPKMSFWAEGCDHNSLKWNIEHEFADVLKKFTVSYLKR